jgi:tetratricopeptide (TPR) repeat protein
LKQYPTDVPALRMLAEVAARLQRYADAEVLLERALELAPSFVPARHNYAVVLHRQRKVAAAWQQVQKLVEADPLNPSYRTLKAALASSIGDYDQALALYAGVLAEYPHNARVWMSYGHSLKTANRQTDCVQTYRKSIELAPHLGEAYWSLANLKTFKFEPADMEAMQTQLTHGKLTPEDRFHFHFALGKALEDAGQYEESFKHYEQGNSLRRKGVGYDAEWNTEQMRRMKALFTPEFFAARAGQGAGAPDPIFIVGLPRSGSTLLEQILSSHTQVEGTMELADIPNLVKELGGSQVRSKSKYPESIAALDADALRALGERYLELTRIYRRTHAPFFIDKLPNNFAHTGLIQLILPRAKIIDARRHPLGCCFSGYKQHFARGQHFTYSLDEIGRYYRDYVELMAHYDNVLPGRVHRVIYERLIEDTEGEVRRVLDYCGLPFEERCLRFYENERAVRTASSEQVRRPIYREGVDHWLNYEPWLGPLKSALGSVLEHYPNVPEF